VRIPVGWWIAQDPTPPKPFVGGSLQALDNAFTWAQKYGMKVIVDLHAVQRSQNGNDHSSPSNPGQIYWDKYEDNVGQTVDSMELYAERYGNHEALLGFCLLNEPAQSNMNVLQDYYKRAYAAVRKHSPDSWIVINPLINPFESGTEGHWTGFMNPDQGYTKVSMDLHYYSCFGGACDQTTADGAIGCIRYDRQNEVNNYHNVNPKPMLVGEWSACGHFDVGRAGDFAKAQVDVYNSAGLGWTFWSWTNGAPNNMWSLKTAFNQGWIDEIQENKC